MNFELNKNGGWNVPANTKFPAGTKFPAHSVFGSYCKFGNDCEFGSCCEFGSRCEFDGYCKFDDCCEFGDSCKFGLNCEFGASNKIGKGSTYAGREILQFINMMNVDGSGRYITIMRHPLMLDGEITVTAGCFFGSLDKFCEKANSEGKPFYAKAITAVADAMLSS